MDAKKKNILDEQGQALVEFLLFLPFMLMMYSVTTSIGNAINASINQQKITRSYFFYRAQNNSTIPAPNRETNTHQSWRLFGMQIIGWMDRLENNVPLAPCYRFRVPLGDSEGDVCESPYSGTSTQHIRIQTVYGMCGATYASGNNGVVLLPGNHSSSGAAFSGQGCLIQ